ncbi:MAG: TetR/AcrR family transcriptional regulator [Gaiellales bacterium]
MEDRLVKSSSRSERMAAQTRADILDAARMLFGRDGYSATSINDIAREAGVSVQTIYARLGSKRGMLVALVDRIDDEVGMAETRPLLEGAKDPAELLEVYVGLTRRFHERCGDVIGALFAAVGAEPDIAAFAEEGRRRHRFGCTVVVQRLETLGGLTSMLTQAVAIAVLTLLTSHESWMELHRQAGLTWDEAEGVLLDLVQGALLAGDPATQP